MPELKIGLNDRLTAEGSADGPPSSSLSVTGGASTYSSGCAPAPLTLAACPALTFQLTGRASSWTT